MQGNGDGTLTDTQQVERRGRINEQLELAGHDIALGVGQASEESLARTRIDDAHRGHEAGDHPHSHEQHCLDASVSNTRSEGAPNVVGAPIACSQHGEATHPPELLEHSGRERPVEGV